ncbi:MAG: EAL domain-containing protein, partial [Spirochaetales bacterium]|nr:EAL domain-containing protein [Spirochaetales bacterium]
RPFIQEIEQAAHAHFVRDIISMAHHINKRVVAEGVETEAQRTLLSALGCDLLQGYLLGRPLGLEEVLEQHESGGGHA